MTGIKRNERGRFAKKAAVAGLDVRSPADANKLNTVLKNGNITLVLIYADWCGHCHRYIPTWTDLEKTPGRKANMARVHYDMQEKVPAIANAKIQGYPSVVKVLPSGELEEYKTPESEEPTNALPTMRDLPEMKKELTTLAPVPAPAAAEASSNARMAFAPRVARLEANKTRKNNRRGASAAAASAAAAEEPVVAAVKDALTPGSQNIVYHGGRRQTRKQRGGMMAGLASAFMGAIKAAGPAALLLLAHGALSSRTKENKTLGGFKGPKRQSRRASTRRSKTRRLRLKK